MSLPETAGGATVYPLSIPAIPPDFRLCSPWYGQDLVEDECWRAAQLLPYGTVPAHYNVVPGYGSGDGRLDSLPYSSMYG